MESSRTSHRSKAGPTSLTSSATSTPLSRVIRTKPEPSNDRQAILKHYVERLMQMKRHAVQQLSIDSTANSLQSSVVSHPQQQQQQQLFIPSISISDEVLNFYALSFINILFILNYKKKI